MKPLHFFFMIIGILIIGAVVYLAAIGVQETKPLGSTEEEVPMVSAEALSEITTQTAGMGQMLSWAVIAFAIILQTISWVSATYKFAQIKRAEMSLEHRFQQLEAIEIYFDLPLYFGLLGTVMSFILITLHPDAGLMFAYVSTALGIVVSVILRLSYLTPYKQDLIAQRASD
ncbi:MAG: hypothetical protein K9M45_13005 [Kiritimatiellales bacterium]|nr:hypothetical protein [Kiritimatiellales bacterium]